LKRKAIIIDLDGTLFNNKKEISEFNISKVNRCVEEDHCVIIATARPLRTLKVRLPLNLKVSYLVLCNGAWIVKNGNVIYRNEMKAEAVKLICNRLITLGYKPAIEADDSFYTDGERDPGFEGHWHSLSEYNDVDSCKVLAYKESGINELELIDILKDDFTYVITDNDTLLQISMKDCTKVSACSRILDIENINWENTFAFGDDNNDLPVFEIAGFPIAMENATEKLKLKAKWVTKSNHENGVGIGIEKFIIAKETILSS
jgi:Cof subfamily protein (haloacid dehalogenase superfamily)